MAARTTRQEARARIRAAFETQLNRLIPEDESVPLKGATFADFKDHAELLAQTTLPVVMEERAALESNAQWKPRGDVRTAARIGCIWKSRRRSGDAVALRSSGDPQAARAMPPGAAGVAAPFA